MRYTSRTKAKIVLAWYHHKRGKPLGALMLRYMAVRLWVELRFQMPPGKTNATREKNYLANTLAGRHAVNQAEVFKHTTAEKVVGWEKPWFVSTVAEENLPAPITEKVTKRVGLTAQRKASIGRAVGAELRHAVEHALGPRWFTDSELMARAVTALTPPQILTNKEDTKS
ncbi:hypothetical protein [Aliiroseovarius marinus]|uniref:hypothetical protein n=1 Tax=Aliiroseovarius marinus TaxID=2500159 RepID=UPI002494AB14|nr:hypothetical protein [Aliiroseovarius marinus]